ncbi:MAG: AAA family ATPase [Deltaproteobacteria bacterium]|jgi:hypothetical protein|nr:AAA family ATPase [Deltaproteobacteria bacterium]
MEVKPPYKIDGKPKAIAGEIPRDVVANPMLPLPISVEEFVKIVNNGQLYVDKTGIIHDLLNYRNKYVFLFRPRRFGKSLLLSTVEAILLGRKELFTDLAIGNTNPEYQFKSSHVIRFSMASFGNKPEYLEKNLVEYLEFFARNKYGLQLTSSSIGGSLFQLITLLYDSYDSIPLGKSPDLIGRTADIPEVVVLVDECDYQLLPNMHDPIKLQATVDFLSDFYSGLKSVSGMIRHLIVTGITKFKVFYQSSSNFISDISLDPAFSSICGFTKDEIRSNFWKHIEYALMKRKDLNIAENSLTGENLYASIEDWYDGYTWDGVTDIFNPISLMEFLSNYRLKQYWYGTGDSGTIKEFLKSDADYFNIFSDNNTIESDESTGMLTEITPYAVLFKTGYLTIKQISSSKSLGGGDGDVITYHLSIPNREVRQSLAKQIIFSRFFVLKHGVMKNDLYSRFSDFCGYFSERDEINSQHTLVSIFSSYSYKLHTHAESYYKTLIFTALCFSSGEVTAEASVGGGDIDLSLELPSDIMVIEVKYNHFPGPVAGKNDAELQKAGAVGSTSASADSITPDQSLTKKGKADRKKNILRLLDKGINDAFSQIESKGYAKKYTYPDQKKNVWLVAVSIVGRDDAEIKFRKALIPSG